MIALIYGIVALVALQRLVELVYAQRNTRALLERGAVEVGRGHYLLIVLVHAGWLAAIALTIPNPPSILWLWLIVFACLQAARVWIILSLGPFWTTRIITLKDAPLVRRGPYRFVRHPNYVIVTLEIACLPLAFREYAVALGFSLLNGAVLAWRVRQENLALAPRRAREALAGGAREG